MFTYSVKAALVFLCMALMYYHAYHVHYWLPLAVFLVDTQLRVWPWAESEIDNKERLVLFSQWFFALNRMVCLNFATTFIMDDIVCINAMCLTTLFAVVTWSVYELWLYHDMSCAEYQPTCVIESNTDDDEWKYKHNYIDMWKTINKYKTDYPNHFVAGLSSFFNIEKDTAVGVVCNMYMSIATRDWRGLFHVILMLCKSMTRFYQLYNEGLETRQNIRWQYFPKPFTHTIKWAHGFCWIPIVVSVLMTVYHIPVSFLAFVLKSNSMPIAVLHYQFLHCARYAFAAFQCLYRLRLRHVLLWGIFVNTVFFRGLYIEDVDRLVENTMMVDSCVTIQNQRFCYDGDPETDMAVGACKFVNAAEYETLLVEYQHPTTVLEMYNQVNIPTSMIVPQDWTQSFTSECNKTLSIDCVRNITQGIEYKYQKNSILSRAEEALDDLGKSYVRVKDFLSMCSRKDLLNQNIKKTFDSSVFHAITSMKQYDSWIMYPQAVILETSYFFLGNMMWGMFESYTDGVFSVAVRFCDTVARLV